MKNLLAAAALLVAASASAELLPAFHFVAPAQLAVEVPAPPAPPSRPADVIEKGHMLIQAGKDVLFGNADTKEQLAEAVAYWSDVLRGAGIEPGVPAYQNGFFTLPYRTADGRVLRDFLAEARQFPPKDENGLRANMALAKSALSAAGLSPVSARVVKVDFLLPTYSILYLAKPELRVESETRLRVLTPGDDIDAGLLAASGVTVVQNGEHGLLVYVGAELGYVGLIAKTPEALAARLAKRKAFLIEQGKRIVGEKLVAVDDAEYKYGVEILFFQ